MQQQIFQNKIRQKSCLLGPHEHTAQINYPNESYIGNMDGPRKENFQPRVKKNFVFCFCNTVKHKKKEIDAKTLSLTYCRVTNKHYFAEVIITARIYDVATFIGKAYSIDIRLQ